MIYTIVFMISPYIIYIKNSDVSIYFHIIYFITLFIIPLVPIMISTILGIIFTTISNLFKERKIINLMLTLIMFLFMLAFSYNMFSNTKETVDDVILQWKCLAETYMPWQHNDAEDGDCSLQSKVRLTCYL